MAADPTEWLGRAWTAVVLPLLACRVRRDLEQLRPQLLHDIGVEPHAIEATALALAERELEGRRKRQKDHVEGAAAAPCPSGPGSAQAA